MAEVMLPLKKGKKPVMSAPQIQSGALVGDGLLTKKAPIPSGAKLQESPQGASETLKPCMKS